MVSTLFSDTAMAVRNPAPGQTVKTYPSPNISDGVLLEWVTSELANSKPAEPGTPHEDQRNYAGYKLGVQRVSPQDHNFTQRIWVTDETSPDAWNAALKFVAESVAHPIFIRAYREPKDNWLATYSRARGSVLKVVTGLHLSTPGSGYKPGTQPALTFSGGGGTGAVGHAIVNPLGTISELVLINAGGNFTSVPTFTIAAPPAGGTTATGTAFIQPTGAVLVSEEAQLYPPDSEFYALYWNVIRVYKTMPGPALTLKSVGSVDHTPNKYKRFVNRTSTVTDPVAPSTALPTLTGTQSYAEVKQNSVAEAAQTIETLEIDASAEPLVGQQTGEFGIETIEESYVADGTDAESGFGVKESAVEPDGTGNSEKRTVRYPDPGVAEVLITTPGTGYTNGTYALGFTGGAGSGAAGTYTVEGTVVVRAKITAPGIYTALPAPTFPSGGSGAVGLAIEGHPAKISRLFDEEMLVTYPRSEQIISVITDAQAALLQVQAQPGEMKELIGIDVWHSRLIKETKTPTAVDEASSIQSTKTRPYSFPGLLPSTPAVASGSNFVLFPFSFRKTTAQLVQANVKTWWVISATKPSIAIDQVITDTVFVFTMEDNAATLIGRRYEGALHDAMTTTYFAGSVGVSNFYNATTPSYTTYTGSWIGTEKVVAASVDPTKQKNLWKVQIEKVVMR